MNRIPTSHVTTVTVIDPDTNLPVDVEIRKMANGLMVGLDGNYLETISDDEHPNSPYNDGVKLIVPDNEAGYCFVTSDGFTLSRVNREDGTAVFTDGDLIFEIDNEGYPLSLSGSERLEGKWDDEPATVTLTNAELTSIKRLLENGPDAWCHALVYKLAEEFNVPEYVLIKLGIGDDGSD